MLSYVSLKTNEDFGCLIFVLCNLITAGPSGRAAYGVSLAEIASPNTAWGIDVCALCVVR